MAKYTGTRIFFLALGRGSTADAPKGNVQTCKADGTDHHTLLPNIGTRPDGLAIDVERNALWYTNMGADPSKHDGFISRINLDGSDERVVVPQGIVYTPKQMSLVKDRDGTEEWLYWCDREGMRVWRAKVSRDASVDTPELLYQAYKTPGGARVNGQSKGPDDDTIAANARTDQTNHCVGIAVDLDTRTFYWTQKGPSKGGVGRLYSAGLQIPAGETPDARSDVKLLMRDLPEPIDLEIDAREKVLYKTDRGAEPRGNTVSKVHLNDKAKSGQLKEDILVNHLHEAIGIDLDFDEGKMWFTDLGGSVYSANLDGTGKTEVLKNVGDLTGIRVVHFS